MLSFNLRREANPLATSRSRRRSTSTVEVSISGEKPIHWRRGMDFSLSPLKTMFQSQARSQSTGDRKELILHRARAGRFQSQARSQSTGDSCFGMAQSTPNICFNLRREANPLATCDRVDRSVVSPVFQSQARSQSTGDIVPVLM